MFEYVLVVAPGILKGISKDWHLREIPSFIHLLGESEDCGSEPRGFNCDGAERVAEDVVQNTHFLHSSPFHS